VSDDLHASRDRAPLAAALGVGGIWGTTLFAVLGFGLPAVARSAGDWSALVLLCGFLALAHAGLFALGSGVVARLGDARWRRAGTVALAVLLGLLYSALALSLLKLATVHSLLQSGDVRFVLASLRQVAGEATAAERRLLLVALALPLGLSTLFLLLLRRLGATAARLEARAAVVLLLAGLGGIVALAATRAEARRTLDTQVPETAAISGWLGGGAVPEGSAEEALADAPAIVPYAPAPPERAWNVVVVMLESIPWARLYGPAARPGSTPRLDALARESIVFDRAYATSTHSDYAQTSILASLHPRKFEGHDYFRELAYPRTLFWDPLVPLGWRSAVFSCQNESWGNMISFLETPNLQLLRHAPDWPEAERRGDGSESKVFETTPIDAFFAWLDAEPERPFAVYLNFQATHYPYVVPAGFRAPYQPSAIDFPTTFLSYPREAIPVMENRFHNALAYVDESVGRVVDGLVARGLLERTALLVVSDHGEAFYEHGLPTHGTTLLEEQVRTAMLLRLPGLAPRRIEQSVSVLDAIPTVYRSMGLPRHGNFQGRDDVLDPGYSAAGRALPMTIQGMTREDGVLLDGWKYLVNWDRRERALFDLGGDPGERRNLAGERADELERLDASLRELLGRQLGYYRARGWEQGRYPPPLP